MENTKIKRVLNFNQGIIPGEDVRDLQEIFPEIKDSFRQRKSFDEYYYDSTKVELNINQIQSLNEICYHPKISKEEIIIEV